MQPHAAQWDNITIKFPSVWSLSIQKSIAKIKYHNFCDGSVIF